MSDAKLILVNDEAGYRHVTVDGNLHSINDAPACVYPDGTRWWYRDGKVHRDGAPAVIYSNGVEEWFQNGLRDRDGGPALIYPDKDDIIPELRGVKQWWTAGKLIREELPPRVQAYRDELRALLLKHFGG